jgi:hypothetical protein
MRLMRLSVRALSLTAFVAVVMGFGARAVAQVSLAPSGLEGDDRLGQSVSIDGDTAVVGAHTDDGLAGVNQGAVYVFRRSGSTWIEEQKLTPDDAAANKQFGESVAISGDTIIVGMTLDNTVSTQAGAAYIFTRTAGVWSQQAKVFPTDGAVFKFFGFNVDIDGDTAIVGGYGDTASGTRAGAAYVFTRSGTVWTQQGKLLADDGAAEDHFGISVGIDGDTALVGAYQDEDTAGAAQGSAYVFTRSGTVWSQQEKLTADDAAADDHFGWSVALSGETALVGAYDDDGAGGAGQGSAYVYTRSGSAWSQQDQLTADDAAAADALGYSVALDGDLALVGASNFFVLDQGSVYVFSRSGEVWTQEQELAPIALSSNAKFGFKVAIGGHFGFVGARRDDTIAGVQSGSAWLFNAKCRADFNVDDAVDGPDLAFTLASWAQSASFSDFNGDAVVDGMDLAFLLASWGPCN